MSEQYKKFGDLSRAEQLELVEHVLDGGEIEMYFMDVWLNPMKGKESAGFWFLMESTYRKVKSELDLLKDQRNELDEKIKKLESGISVGDTVIKKLDSSKREHEVIRCHLNENAFIIDGRFYLKHSANDQFIKVK